MLSSRLSFKPETPSFDKIFCSGLRTLRIGASDELTVEVNVTNLANDAAYRSQVFITYPQAIEYIGGRLQDQVRQYPI